MRGENNAKSSPLDVRKVGSFLSRKRRRPSLSLSQNATHCQIITVINNMSIIMCDFYYHFRRLIIRKTFLFAFLSKFSIWLLSTADYYTNMKSTMRIEREKPFDDALQGCNRHFSIKNCWINFKKQLKNFTELYKHICRIFLGLMIFHAFLCKIYPYWA